MASLAVLTLKEAIIPIVPSFNVDELRTTKVENKWTSTGSEQYAKMYLPVCSDPSQKELLLYVVNQFIDAAHSDRLHLTVGSQRYVKFRSVLDGDLRLTWQGISDGRANKTIDSFHEDLRSLIGTYLHETSYDDQLEYMRSATKPFSMSCAALGSRIRVISQLGKHLPGSHDGNNSRLLYTDDNSLKRAFFLLMPSAWRVKFAESGNVLDGNYTYQNLVRFMSVQELISKKTAATTAGGKRRAPGRSGGRGFSGGRGRGRTNYGTYRPRYGESSYGAYSSRGRGTSGPTTPVPTTPIPYGARTPAGRFSSTGRGFVSTSGGRSSRGGYSGGRSSGYSPQRTAVQPGRNPPYFPNFYTDHYMADGTYHGEGHPPYDSYVTDQGYDYPASEEQYHVDGRAHAQPHDQYYYGESHGHYESSGQEQGDVYHVEEHEQEEEKQAAEEVHWLDEFGL